MDAGDDETVLRGAGGRIRTLRTGRGLTLAGLAEQTGLTVSTLSRLETSRIRPTLEQLLPLARAFAMPLDELVAAPPTGDPRIHLRPVTRRGLVFVPLGIRADGMHAFKIVYPPMVPASTSRSHSHPGREWFYVLSGEIVLIVGDRADVLRAGEAAEFDTRLPHHIGSAVADRGAEVIAVFDEGGQRIHIGGGRPSRPAGDRPARRPAH